MKKKILSLVLALCLLLALMPQTSLTALASKSDTDVAYAVTGGNIYFDKATGTITDCDETVTSANIPAEIDGVAVTSIGNSAFSNLARLTSVTIPDSVTNIGAEAFMYCTSLTSVTIPNSVTSIKEAAFRYCTSLTSVTIPDSVTSIEEFAFWYCTSLTSVTIPDSVTSIGNNAFSDCTSLTGIWVSAENPNYSSDERGVLFNKDKTELLQAPGALEGDYSIPNSVTTIESGAFEDCTSLTSVTIPNSVITIGWTAFYGCKDLTSVTIPDSVTNIGARAFMYCTSLTSVTIPDGVSSIVYNTFYGCTSLTSVTIPNSVTSIETRTFEGCTSLTSVTILSSITEIGSWAFDDCINLKQVYFLGDAPEIGSRAFYLYDKTSNSDIVIPGLTLYYVEGKEGWTSPTWNGYPTATWDPNHVHSYTAAVTNPTCTEQGYTTYTCDCGDSYVDTYVDALGHDYRNNVCTRCGDQLPVEPVPTVTFTDVPDEAWFKDSVNTAVSLGLINGMGNNEFQPDVALTRGMLVVLLYRLAGEPETTGQTALTDVDSGSWYEDAVIWAEETGITTGYPDGTFAPGESVNREQTAVFFHRFAEQSNYSDGVQTALDGFPDVSEVSEYAADSMAWAVENEILSGNSINGTICLDSQGSATRAQGAAVLVRFYNNFVG